MDKFLEIFHKNGMLATIGKGERTTEATKIIKKYQGKYFTAQGGIARADNGCSETTRH